MKLLPKTVLPLLLAIEGVRAFSHDAVQFVPVVVHRHLLVIPERQ